MKISLNWLKDYIDFDLTNVELEHYLTDLGLEVEGMETVGTIIPDGVIVGEVIEKIKHPDADKLSVTQVKLGENDVKQIVCGAPNVAAGQKVLVATVGTTLLDKDGNPFSIKNAKIRGQESFGMICSASELQLSDDHSGIMVLSNDAKVGTPASDVFKNLTDTVIEIGLTPNRADATNHIGVARDLAAKLSLVSGKRVNVKSPDTSKFAIGSIILPIEIEVLDSVGCPRYSGVVISGIKVAPSPEWLQTRLGAIGVRSINNVVDITNYILNEYGQPLHAFDYDEIKDKKIIVEQLAAGKVFLALDGTERKLNGSEIIIADGKHNPMCLGGVFGGKNSGVTEKTTTIFLESAHFDAKKIRNTSTAHDLRTDAARIYEKGSDPSITVEALKRAALLIQELAGGEVASEIMDLYPNRIDPKQIDIAYQFINDRIGIDLTKETVHNVLESMDIFIESEYVDGLTVNVPTNKPDVIRNIDLVEEILRVYGFNNIDADENIVIKKLHQTGENPMHYSRKVTDMLVAMGYNEMMNMSQSQSLHIEKLIGNTDDIVLCALLC
jgi:phenylalanyl-tRNA synthetase beta chain